MFADGPTATTRATLRACQHRLAATEAQLLSYAQDLRVLYQVERAHREQIEQAYHSTLVALSRALDLRDTETEEHSLRVTDCALTIGRALGLAPGDLTALELGAMLHDVGKIGIPDSILRKPGPLSAQEWGVMRQHPQLGYEILSAVDFLATSLPVVLHHHEKWDGTGYPDGLSGESIPLTARIFAVADAFDAMTASRPYKSALSSETTFERLQADAGRHFDPRVVSAFLEAVSHPAVPPASAVLRRP